MKWINEHLTCSLFLEFVKPALNSLTTALVSGNFFERSACNSLAFSQIIASETLSRVNCCSLIHTNNNNSTSLIVCDLCFGSTFTLFVTSASLISFSSPGWNWLLMQTSSTSWRDQPRIHYFRILLRILSWILSFLAFFIKGLALGTFFGPMVAYLAVALNKQVQKTMDYYKMFRMNVLGDAHSTRNKGRLSHEHMGCFVWPLDSGKCVAESRGQADEFGMEHFQLYVKRENQKTTQQEPPPRRSPPEPQWRWCLLLKYPPPQGGSHRHGSHTDSNDQQIHLQWGSHSPPPDRIQTLLWAGAVGQDGAVLAWTSA